MNKENTPMRDVFNLLGSGTFLSLLELEDLRRKIRYNYQAANVVIGAACDKMRHLGLRP